MRRRKESYSSVKALIEAAWMWWNHGISSCTKRFREYLIESYVRTSTIRAAYSLSTTWANNLFPRISESKTPRTKCFLMSAQSKLSVKSDKTWCGVWCGVVWCGVVWCGVVWCGVVWCGVMSALHRITLNCVLKPLVCKCQCCNQGDRGEIGFVGALRNWPR